VLGNDQSGLSAGLLMVHLETIASRLIGKPPIWVLRSGRVQSERAWDYLKGMANRRNVPVNMLFQEECQRIGLPKSAMPTEI
jgi:hypothetical protein